MKINKHYQDINESYLFFTIEKKTKAFLKKNPNAKIIKMGIGDVTRPLSKVVVKALVDASNEMGVKETFRGYGPYPGYDFLREAIKDYYLKQKVNLTLDDIFVSDGAKSEIGNILDIFDIDNLVLIPDPVYPVYVDSNIMQGRKVSFLDANEDNNFLAMPDFSQDADIIYLCSPNNPTGATYNYEQLKEWVDYAILKKAVILFDAAYEAFITEKDKPRSIFEIAGARQCAIEFCSLSKTAGFTGTRLGYTIIPQELKYEGISINKMWLRRQSTKFNGVPYIIQKGGEAVFSEEGLKETSLDINYYQRNAKVIMDTLNELGIYYTGGINSPYIWMKCPNAMASWDFFDYLLENVLVVGTPGSGFGKNGEGYFRLSTFGDYELTKEAMKRIKEKMV